MKRLILMTLITLLVAACQKHTSEPIESVDLTQYVDPFIGTGFHGHTFPGAVMPHGMLQLSPDTKLNGWDASSGYHYDDNTIYGFSHTHLSGTGIGDMGDVLILPFTGEVSGKPVAEFSKENEHAEVGFYEVSFDNFPVKAGLTATMRAGMHRYEFGENTTKRLLVDIGHILQRTWGHDNVYNELEIIDDKTIKGLKHSSGWAADHKTYFFAEFSSPFTIEEIVSDEDEADPESKFIKGKAVHAFLRFDELNDNDQLIIKVGISPVDDEGAQKNLQAEMPGWSFEDVVESNKKAWRKALSKIRVYDDSEEEMTIFYTALYHSMIAPMTYQDIDGRYRGMDLQVHQNSDGQMNYTVFSLWDTFRALHPLMTIIEEDLSVDWVNNLILKYEQGGLLPKWPLASNYTGTMVGYPAVANLADALTKGFEGIDKEKALEAMLASASWNPAILETSPHRKIGEVMTRYNKFINEGVHIPADSIVKSVSYGLENAYYDWCIAQVAEMIGSQELKIEFLKRSENYKNYFDHETGFMRGRNADGSWQEPFNPKYSSHEEAAYVEGNAWQWTWFVPHDIEGFKSLYGGDGPFVEKLDSLFTTSSEIYGETASADITGLIGQYAHGNEPSHHIAYFYTHAGEPWKTQELVDRILRDFYSTQPDGIIGNEDCGQMSAWYVLNAMGFYQIAPGNPVYTIGRPIFDKVEIPHQNGNVFTVITENNSADNKYVQQVYLDGEPLKGFTFNHQAIKNGSTLKFVMGPDPKLN